MTNRYIKLPELNMRLEEMGLESEIKLRAWDKVQQKMQYDGSVRFDGAFIIADYTRFMSLHPEEVGFTDNCILMQYTGPKDINNKGVCESDFVQEKTINRVFLVVRNVSEARFDLVFISGENGYPGQIRHFVDVKNMEIIGNKFENPELLEGGG